MMQSSDRIKATGKEDNDFQGKNGLWASSWATVVMGPWPGRRMVSGGRVRTPARIDSRAGR